MRLPIVPAHASPGSRERYKWVTQYDSYHFDSQRWKLIAHHFCSINTWLDGLCVPQHPELWRPRRCSKQQQQIPAPLPSASRKQQQRGSTGWKVAWAQDSTTRTAWDAQKYSVFKELTAEPEAPEKQEDDERALERLGGSRA